MNKLFNFKSSGSLLAAMLIMVVLMFFASATQVKAQDIDLLLKGGPPHRCKK
jgi:hypothetical protein